VTRFIQFKCSEVKNLKFEFRFLQINVFDSFQLNCTCITMYSFCYNVIDTKFLQQYNRNYSLSDRRIYEAYNVCFLFPIEISSCNESKIKLLTYFQNFFYLDQFIVGTIFFFIMSNFYI
jgi:hypothetical protein